MSTTNPSSSHIANVRPTAEQLNAASKIELRGKDGQTTTFGAVTRGKRTVVVFIRHFCMYNHIKQVVDMSPDSKQGAERVSYTFRNSPRRCPRYRTILPVGLHQVHEEFVPPSAIYPSLSKYLYLTRTNGGDRRILHLILSIIHSLIVQDRS
jgi:hypothetical protein